MTRRKKSRTYTGSPIGLPSVLVALGWWALWLVWPTDAVSPSKAPRHYPFKISFVPGALLETDLNGTTFQSTPRAIPEGETEPSRALVEYWAKHARYLRQPGLVSTKLGPAVTNSSPSPDGSYRYRPNRSHLFTRKAAGPLRLEVELSGSLKDLGFQVPELSLDKHKGNAPWQLALYVDIGENGRPEHVFLESGSGNPELDQLIMRSLYQGHVSRAGKHAEGRVTVNYGR